LKESLKGFQDTELLKKCMIWRKNKIYCSNK